MLSSFETQRKYLYSSPISPYTVYSISLFIMSSFLLLLLLFLICAHAATHSFISLLVIEFTVPMWHLHIRLFVILLRVAAFWKEMKTFRKESVPLIYKQEWDIEQESRTGTRLASVKVSLTILKTENRLIDSNMDYILSTFSNQLNLSINTGRNHFSDM